jgi:hypothetical protein
MMRSNAGDCYFVSFVAAISETPERIKFILGSIEVSPYGI